MRQVLDVIYALYVVLVQLQLLQRGALLLKAFDDRHFVCNQCEFLCTQKPCQQQQQQRKVVVWASTEWTEIVVCKDITRLFLKLPPVHALRLCLHTEHNGL